MRVAVRYSHLSSQIFVTGRRRWKVASGAQRANQFRNEAFYLGDSCTDGIVRVWTPCRRSWRKASDDRAYSTQDRHYDRQSAACSRWLRTRGHINLNIILYFCQRCVAIPLNPARWLRRSINPHSSAHSETQTYWHRQPHIANVGCCWILKVIP